MAAAAVPAKEAKSHVKYETQTLRGGVGETARQSCKNPFVQQRFSLFKKGRDLVLPHLLMWLFAAPALAFETEESVETSKAGGHLKPGPENACELAIKPVSKNSGLLLQSGIFSVHLLASRQHPERACYVSAAYRAFLLICSMQGAGLCLHIVIRN